MKLRVRGRDINECIHTIEKGRPSLLDLCLLIRDVAHLADQLDVVVVVGGCQLSHCL